MRRVGTVVRTAGGVAVARSPDESRPDLGDVVLDDALDGVGRVVDVFGPVGRPYFVVTPDNGNPAALLNEQLYVR